MLRKVLISLVIIMLCISPVFALSGCDEEDISNMLVVRVWVPGTIVKTATSEDFLNECKFDIYATSEQAKYFYIYYSGSKNLEQLNKEYKEKGYEKIEKADPDDDSSIRYKVFYYTNLNEVSYSDIKAKKIPVTLLGYGYEKGKKSCTVTIVIYGERCVKEFDWKEA